MSKISESELIEWFKKELNISESELRLHTQLYSSGILSSFTIVKLVRFLETKTNSRFPDDNLAIENFETLNSILSKILK